ncbi:MAG: hypothetical protein RJB66_434 [Pseudomonadota bacterium]|jgi:TrmH family RNA methyltransferase
MKEINSPQNEQFKYWKSLTKSKGLKEGHHFLLSGSKLVEETLLDHDWSSKVEVILKTKKQTLPPIKTKAEVVELAIPLFDEIDILGTHSPILVLQQPQWPQWKDSVAPQGLELLCPFGDPQNLGALLRTAYGFGASKVVLLKESAHPLLPKSMKASSGAILKMAIEWGPSIHEIGPSAIALDLAGTPISSKKWPTNIRLLLGEEGPGVPASFSGERITLPMKNPLESLNAALAAGIAIYEFTQR